MLDAIACELAFTTSIASSSRLASSNRPPVNADRSVTIPVRLMLPDRSTHGTETARLDLVAELTAASEADE